MHHDATTGSKRPRLRVGILSQWYDPEPVPLPHDLARALTERGHRVSVVTSFPQYPGGTVAEGYRQRLGWSEVRDGVTVHRVPSYPSHDRSALRRALTYGSFAVASACASRRLAGCDVVYVYASPLTAALGAWVLQRLSRVPYVVHVQDLWPDSVLGAGMLRRRSSRGLASWAVALFASAVYRRASAILAIAPTMAATLGARGADPSRVATVYNWSSSVAESSDRSARPDDDEVRVLFAGNVGLLQDLDTVLHGLAALGDDSPVRLQVVGDGLAKEHLVALARTLGLTRVSFGDPVPPSAMRDLYGWADFALVPLADLPVLAGTIPSKLQAALAHGVPVLTTAPGDVARIVTEHGCGLVATPGDPADVARALKQACADRGPTHDRMRAAARATHAALFDREAVVDRVEGLLARASVG